ncbi:MarR family transcriptional regulator [Bradyrhizobium sp. RT6a]|uniref:MarR family winged helix-turn-helix transcriptional regulator n=1 Tax=Bradyrhizobium sp. RT6a TaxID=3156381 RepID=UPI003394BB64
MLLAREAVELLVQASRIWYFEGNQHGLRDREWMALRFLGRANRFSRTPSALAGFIGATRATASQIVKTLESKSFLVRKPSQKDKRSIVLHVTAQGEKCLNQHDPVNHVLNAVTALGADECVRLRDLLRAILSHLDAAHQRLDASVCRDCMFLTERGPGTGKRRATAEFTCRLYRAPVALEETELLCTNFELTRDRPKLKEHRDLARAASQG